MPFKDTTPALSELIREAKQEFYELCRQSLPGIEEARSFGNRIAGIIGDFFSTMKSRYPWAVIGVGGLGRGELSFLSDIDVLFLYRSGLEKTFHEFIQTFTYSLWDVGVEIGHNTLSLTGAIVLAKENFSVFTSHITSKFIAGDLGLYSEWRQRLRRLVGSKGKRVFLQELKKYLRSRLDRYGDSSYLLEPHVKEGIGGLRDVHIVRWICWVIYGTTDYESLPDDVLSRDEKLWLIEAENFLWQVRLQLHAMRGRRQDQIYFTDLEKLVASALGEFIGAYSSLEHRRNPSQVYKNTHLDDKDKKQSEGDIRETVEAFMRNYYQHTSRIRRISTFLFERFKYMVMEKTADERRFFAYIPKGEPVADGLFLLEGNHIRFANPSDIAKRPSIMMALFREAALRGSHFHHRTGQIIRAHLPFLTDDVRCDAGVIEHFFEILLNSNHAFNVLKMMMETGFLQTFIPEFQHVRYRVQYDAYHLYTVDEHLLRTVRELHLIETSPDPSVERMKAPDIIRRLTHSQHKCLFLAALLHDIGKGHGKNHAERGAAVSDAICERLGIHVEERELVKFLIRHHLVLAETALKRDLSDEKPIVRCATVVEDVDRLDMLYLLTIADSKATGPSAWNTWRASLLRELYGKVRRVLSGRDWQTDVGQRIKAVQSRVLELFREKMALSETDEVGRITAWCETLSHRYLLSQPPEAIVEHYFMEKQLSEISASSEYKDALKSALVVRTEPVLSFEGGARQDLSEQSDKGGDIWQVTVATYDRPGLFALITGVLWCCGVNILSADIFTRSSGIALDVLLVNQLPDPLRTEELWDRFKRDMERSLQDRSYLDQLIQNRVSSYRLRRTIPPVRPDRVVIDEESSDFYTIVEVYTWDRPGVLYAIADELFRLELSIQLAKITTPGAQVADVFYVTTLDGSKLMNPEFHEHVRERILARLVEIPSN
ncbi:MAG: HD domain-containing protein [Thermodesulforhabdaceae bacterium]